jgi:hypothetical protein
MDRRIHLLVSGHLSDSARNRFLVSFSKRNLAFTSENSSGSAADLAATDPVTIWFGRDKKLATTFFKPGKYNRCTLHSEMNAKWRCCLGEMGAETWEMAVTSGL